jgi:hypothetical protein
MKNYLCAAVLLAASLCAAPVLAASAAPSCDQSARQLQQKTGEFVKRNADGRHAAHASSAKPGDFYRSISGRDSALHAIANDVWTLRADMASRGCRQAAGFAY